MAEGTNKYAGNSHTDKETRKAAVPSITDVPENPPEKLDAVIGAGKAVTKKPSLGKRLRENFVGEDANTIGSYIFLEIVVPSVKGLIIDVVQQGIVRAMGGNPSMGPRIPGSKQGGGYMPYSTISTSKAMRPDPREPVQQAIRPQTYDQVAFAELGDAEVVLDRMFEQVREYNVVTIANFYDFAAVSNMNNFQDNKFGWNADMLRGVRVQGTLRQGYYLNLPRPLPLD